MFKGTTRCTKCWLNLTLKCYPIIFVKADAQIEEECLPTIFYLQGYSYLKLYCKKLSNQKPTSNTVRKNGLRGSRYLPTQEEAL